MVVWVPWGCFWREANIDSKPCCHHCQARCFFLRTPLPAPCGTALVPDFWNAHPGWLKLLQVIGRMFSIGGILKRSKRIGHIRTKQLSSSYRTIGNGVLGCHPRYRIDLVVDVFAFCLVFCFVVLLVYKASILSSSTFLWHNPVSRKHRYL